MATYLGTHDFTGATVTGAGGVASQYDASVGSSGADYLDIQAAITGVGGTDIKLVLITDITEDSDIACGGISLVINLSSYKLTMAAFQFTGAAPLVQVFGNGIDSGAEIDYTATVANEELFNVTGAAITRLDGLVWDNNSSAAGTNLIAAGQMYVNNVRIELPNQNDAGLRNRASGNTVSNLEIVGGGAACEDAINLSDFQIVATNILVSGAFIAAADADYAIKFSSDAVASNLNFGHITNDIGLAIGADAVVSNVTIDGSLNVDVFIIGNDAHLSNAELQGGILDFRETSFSQISNVKSTGLLDLSGNPKNNLITNCKFDTAMSFGGDRNKISNCDFIGGVTLVTGALNNIFTGCQFGVDGGAGALTLTLNSGANSNIVTSCISDVAVVDNGTSNSVANNVVY